MTTARATLATGNAGTTSSALAVSGETTPGNVANTEAFIGQALQTKTLTVS
jgi:hypothetical protein